MKIPAGSKKSSNFFVKGFLLENRPLRIVLLPIIFLMVFSNWAEIRIPKLAGGLKDCFITKDKARFQTCLCQYILVTLAHYLAAFGYRFIFMGQLYAIKSLFLERCVSYYLQMSYSEYNTKGTGRITAAINRQANALVSLLEILFISAGYSVIFFLMCVLSIFKNFPVGWGIATLITLSVVLAYIILSAIAVSRLKSRVNEEEYVYSNKLFDIFRNYSIVKSFNNVAREVSSFSRILPGYVAAGMEYSGATESFSFFFRLILFVPSLAACVFCFSYGAGYDIFMYNLFVDYFLKVKKRISTIKSNSYDLADYLSDVSGLERGQPEEASTASSAVDLDCNEVQFKDVSVYKGCGGVIIRPFSLTLRRRDKVAITGRNGVGKSTLLRMLMGFEEYKGDILFDGKSVSDVSLKSLRAAVSYVPQEPYIMNDSVWNVLTYGSSWGAERIIELCIKCGMHKTFKSLPKGYETVLGEEGTRLSGGQRQMLNFMRAVAKDSPIFLLDEPTSQLDCCTTKKLLDLISELLQDKIVLFTTHCPLSLSQFDRIINIRDKQVTIYESYSEFAAKCDLSQDI